VPREQASKLAPKEAIPYDQRATGRPEVSGVPQLGRAVREGDVRPQRFPT